MRAISEAEGWTCTSDEDDLAVSKKLEELQQQKKIIKSGSALDTGVRLSDVQNGVPLTCLPPDKILYVYQSSDINTWSSGDTGKDGRNITTGCRGGVGPGSVIGVGVGRGDVGGSGNGGGGSDVGSGYDIGVDSVDNCLISLNLGGTACINYANLEINPSAIITNAVDIPLWSGLMESSVNANQCRRRVLSTDERRKLWFGTTRTRPKPTSQKIVPTKKRVAKHTKAAKRPSKKRTGDVSLSKPSQRQKHKEKGDVLTWKRCCVTETCIYIVCMCVTAQVIRQSLNFQRSPTLRRLV